MISMHTSRIIRGSAACLMEAIHRRRLLGLAVYAEMIARAQAQQDAAALATAREAAAHLMLVEYHLGQEPSPAAVKALEYVARCKATLGSMAGPAESACQNSRRRLSA